MATPSKKADVADLRLGACAGEQGQLDIASVRSALWVELLRIYMRRRTHLPSGVDADAFDLLLALDVAHFEGRTVAATELGLSAGLTRSTGLRKVQALAGLKLIECDADAQDARRIRVRLSPLGRRLVRAQFYKIFRLLEDPIFGRGTGKA